MVQRHIKKADSTSPEVRQTKVKAAKTRHDTRSRMTSFKRFTMARVPRMWNKETFLCYWWGCEITRPLWKTIWQYLLHDPFLGTHPAELHACLQQQTHVTAQSAMIHSSPEVQLKSPTSSQ